jgi:hypothetical protein
MVATLKEGMESYCEVGPLGFSLLLLQNHFSLTSMRLGDGAVPALMWSGALMWKLVS